MEINSGIWKTTLKKNHLFIASWMGFPHVIILHYHLDRFIDITNQNIPNFYCHVYFTRNHFLALIGTIWPSGQTHTKQSRRFLYHKVIQVMIMDWNKGEPHIIISLSHIQSCYIYHFQRKISSMTSKFHEKFETSADIMLHVAPKYYTNSPHLRTKGQETLHMQLYQISLNFIIVKVIFFGPLLSMSWYWVILNIRYCLRIC